MVIVSPFEANNLLARKQDIPNVAMHVYKPRISLSYPAFDDLDCLIFPARVIAPHIPTPLLVQLNLFAGQLYFTSYQTYLDTCEFLDIPTEGATEGTGSSPSPVGFFKSLMGKVRRDGERIGKPHMGRLLNGGLLREEDFM
ncbi:hypothetical protein LTR62_000908 [Meristemomyces frigidus]|uniref:Uncharacterized protein n=1 Tax=Meristemomyces frigidus TaxID=1508187 RepID=A0AAN7YC25_9PEZI|nr:hypothetical protein LTR62_000908 [Meristemomyces frigidus]